MSFSESQQDITGSYQNINIEIKTEKSRLTRYNKLYDETQDAEQRVLLIDRIFNQERRIKYLEDSLKNLDKRIDYSTIYFNINEERSDYANIVFVKIGDLAKTFVNNLNSVLKLIFGIVPWAVAALIAFFGYRLVKKKNS